MHIDPSPALIFSLSLALSLVLYLVGGIIGAKGKKSVGKVAPYSCGEDLPPIVRERIDLERFLLYAIYFFIFDILAFVLATSFGTPGYLPAIYAFIVLMAIVVLLPLWRRG